MKATILTAFLLCIVTLTRAQQLSPAQQQATDLFKAGKADEAIALFKKALAENAKDLYSINALSIMYFNNGRYADAYEVAGKGVAASSGAIPFVAMQCKAGYKLGKYAEVMKLTDAYNAKHTPPDAGLLYIKGEVLQAKNDLQGALAAYSQGIAANAENVDAYLARGKIFSELLRNAQAIKDYDKYIALAPDESGGYSVRGVAYQNSGKYTEAMADYNKAISLNPKDFYAFSHRGECYAAIKNNASAVADFNTAILLAPDYPDTYCQLARIYVNMERGADALTAIGKAISLDPGRAAFYNELSRDQSAADHYTEALAAAEKAITLAPKDAEGYMWKAVALSNASKADEAIAAATAGLAQSPGYYLLYSTRASIYRMNGKVALADADDAKAKELAAK